MDECVYFTRRSTGEEGSIVAWVFKKKCQKCNSGIMIKPSGKKGKPDKKSPVYVCSKCNTEEDNKSVEAQLIVNVEYTCPFCKNAGEATTEYARKKFQGILSYIFECGKCGKKIGITKKMKE